MSYSLASLHHRDEDYEERLDWACRCRIATTVLRREEFSAAEGLDPSLSNLLSLPRDDSVLSQLVFMIDLTTRLRAEARKSGDHSCSVSFTKVDGLTGALTGGVLGWMSIRGAPLKL